MSSSSLSDRPPPALPRARSSTSTAAASPRRRPSTPVRAAASPRRCRPLTRRARRPGHGSSSYETPPRGTGSRELELPCSTAQLALGPPRPLRMERRGARRRRPSARARPSAGRARGRAPARALLARPPPPPSSSARGRGLNSARGARRGRAVRPRAEGEGA